MVNSKTVKCLVDTGCSSTLVRSGLVTECVGTRYVNAFDGRAVKCKGKGTVTMQVSGTDLTLKAVVSDEMVDGVEVLMGMDVIDALGGVTVLHDEINFGVPGKFISNMCSLVMEAEDIQDAVNRAYHISDRDFSATFDGKMWTVKWVWKDDQPVHLNNRISCYDSNLSGKTLEEFDKEVVRWIDEGILMPWKEEVSEGIIPMLAVVQPTKDKVRPVLDFRELNKFVECHTGDDVIDVCEETLRKWRRVGTEASVVDLKSAYLQIRVDESLWKYQLVKFKGKTYCLTRLGFGLNCAPRIMSKILKTVLDQLSVRGATSSYIDDILVDEQQVSSQIVIDHLNAHGLVTKPPMPLCGGAVLGLKMCAKDGEPWFSRGNCIPDLPSNLSKRELFSICGSLVGHYPVAGWLRIACSYVKRRSEGATWDDFVGDEAVGMIGDVLARVHDEDPVRGYWFVERGKSGVVWCDASCLGVGAAVEVNGRIIEDAAWLRKKDDYNHINVAELESVLKGINLAIKWGLQDLEVKTDSATVCGWMKTVITEDRRVRTKGAAEMIVKRRLGTLRELIDEYSLRLTVTLVPSAKNKADMLTRVKKQWLATDPGSENVTEVCCNGVSVDLGEVHKMHHMGVERTLYLARKLDPSVTKGAVKKVVGGCARCQSIDPAPVTHCPGELSVKVSWSRLAVDVTHYRQIPYLSMVDCGPSRFAIWRQLKREDAGEISRVLEEIFLERGPVQELLMDNGTAFRSEILIRLLERWGVNGLYRAAYRPSGNGIVERHHRTIKTLAERGRISPQQAVFWYNLTPRSGQDDNTVPQRLLYKYDWRHPLSTVPKSNEEPGAGTIQIGDEVWVKPPHARCTTEWKKGQVTTVNSRNNISVDGMPRHVLDVRPVIVHDSTSEDSAEEVIDDNDRDAQEGRRPQRVRKPPTWMDDYVTK